MSGSIFGDDDDFELVGGSDTPSAIRKPPAETPAARPLGQRAPSSTPSVAPTEPNKNTGSRSIPSARTTATGSTATGSTPSLPRPKVPATTNKTPARRPLPNTSETAKIAAKPAQERAEISRPIASTPSESPARDTKPSQNVVPPRDPVVIPPSEPEQTAVANSSIQPDSNRYFETGNETADVHQDSRRIVRHDDNEHHAVIPPSRDNEIDDRFSNRRSQDDYHQEDTAAPKYREESPRSFYSQKPYVPVEPERAAPSRTEQPARIEQPIQSYPDAHTSPTVNRPPQEAPAATSKATKKTRSPKTRKTKPEKVKGPSNFSGGRAGIIAVRVVAISIVSILMLAGGKSIFFPETIPDPTTITNVVKKRLGVTEFPAADGQAFVTSFTRIYLTVDPADPNSSDNYDPYMSDSLSSSMTSSSGTEIKQTITEGPIVSGIKSVDDSNAIYTVGAKLNSSENWIYIDVPVYFDKDNVGFAVSGMPAFAPAPTKITVPPADAPFEQDTKLADDIKSSVMEQFFPAWAASNTAGINLIVLKTANSEAKIGLANSVKFASIQSFSVERKETGDAEETTRKAQATVIWASPTNPKITYTQQYNLVLFRQPDNRWYIKELSSGVRS